MEWASGVSMALRWLLNLEALVIEAYKRKRYEQSAPLGPSSLPTLGLEHPALHQVPLESIKPGAFEGNGSSRWRQWAPTKTLQNLRVEASKLAVLSSKGKEILRLRHFAVKNSRSECGMVFERDV